MEEPLNELEESWSHITYLIGSMEFTAAKDDGQSMRTGVEKELLLRDVYPINPVRLESKKTGMTTDEVKEKMAGWLASGNWELFTARAEDIWLGKDYIDEEQGLLHIPGDVDYCIMADWLTFTYNKGDRPCGSFAECGIAMAFKKPIYLITDMPKKELPKSLLQMICVTKGEVFNTVNEYLIFIDKLYGLKRREPKEK